MEELGSPETPVFAKTTWRNIPEDEILQIKSLLGDLNAKEDIEVIFKSIIGNYK
jgi:hypothetical protein